MASNSTSNRNRQDEENEITDNAGRRHNSRGQFVAGEEDNNENTGANRNRAGNAKSQQGQDENESANSRQRAGGAAGNRGNQNQGANRVLSRAVRVLNEIESRIHELREELEQQTGGANGRGGRSAEDDDSEPGGQGRVKHPESDRRLRQNRDGVNVDTDEEEVVVAGQANRNNRGGNESNRTRNGRDD